jgi:hypothetical protein
VAKLTPGGPPIVTTTPKLVVDPGTLPQGSWRFTLVVEDAATGVKSQPSSIVIVVTTPPIIPPPPTS